MSGNPFAYAPAFPQDFSLVDPHGLVTPGWAYFFRALWNKTGSAVPVPQTFYIALGTNTAGALVPFIFDVNGLPIGQIATTTPRQAPQIQHLSTSPFVFKAPVSGFMTVPGGKVEYSRDGLAYYEIGLVGGQISVLDGDSLRISWFNPAGPPDPVVWWAGGFVQ